MVRDFKHGDTELSRVLRATFGRIPPEEREALAKETIASLGEREESGYHGGDAPGTAYGGGPQTQKGGPKGKAARKLEQRYDALFDGIDLQKCGIFGNEDCLELFSRILEQTFRNFQIHARPPSHISPPFSARIIDNVAHQFALPALESFLTLATFTIPRGRYRGVITHLGQAAENAAAFADIRWRVTIDGTPFPPWQGFLGPQLWQMLPPTQLCAPINLRGGQIIAIESENTSINAHTVSARICGWYYPIRTETGDNIRSTIVD